MLPALLVCTTFTFCVAGPLHKYPYVFLLDVGNEELEKVNTEQLRISIPGGSLAMKYPVLGEGDTISHVRISGIDFGTDLKVNIVEGGPGYKYVVLVFIGNPGVTYDAVVTLQTLPSGMDINEVDKSEVVNTKMKINSNSYEVSDPDDDENDEGSNNKAMTMKQYKANSNSEVMQSSSTFYNYAKGAINTDNYEESEDTSAEEQDDDDNDDDDDVSSKGEDEDENSASSNEDNDSFNEENESFHGQSESSDENNEASNEENSDEDVNQSAKNNEYFIQNNDLISPRAEQYTYNIEDSSSADDKPADILDDNLYEKYLDLKPHFPDGFKVYPQSYIYNKQYQVNSDYDKEDPVELEQMFNDEEVHSDSKYNDGSNSIDSDYAAVEY